MNKILLLYTFVTCTTLAQEPNSDSLRVITIESQHSATNIILQDTDQTKIDLFYYHNTTYNTRRLLLPKGINDSAHMLSLVENQLKKVQSDLTEAERLEKDYNHTTNTAIKDFPELVVFVIFDVAKRVTWKLTKAEALKKIGSINKLKEELQRLNTMKKLITQ